MGLRAVIFDYGMVLTGETNLEAQEELLRITGLPLDEFESFYWRDRHAYDEGKLTGMEFWRKLVSDAGLGLGENEVKELNDWDARFWTTQNPAMLAWQQELVDRGLLTAILSNMGDNVLDNMKREFDWLPRFDALVWSYQLRIAKPDPAIYYYTLNQLGTRPGETFFLDDKLVNVEAARGVGMKALQFTTVEQLRADLIRRGLDAELPLPG